MTDPPCRQQCQQHTAVLHRGPCTSDRRHRSRWSNARSKRPQGRSLHLATGSPWNLETCLQECGLVGRVSADRPARRRVSPIQHTHLRSISGAPYIWPSHPCASYAKMRLRSKSTLRNFRESRREDCRRLMRCVDSYTTVESKDLQTLALSGP